MKSLLFSFAVVLLFSGCLKSGSSDDTCSYDACSLVAPASEIASVQSYLSTNGLTATQHCSGLFYTIDSPGTGAAPTVCNTVVVNYEGRLTNGTVFDKTTTTPASFSLTRVITGFKNGVPLIKTGGKITLYVPPSLGYGNQAQTGIPANSVLIFKIDLLGIQ